MKSREILKERILDLFYLDEECSLWYGLAYLGSKHGDLTSTEKRMAKIAIRALAQHGRDKELNGLIGPGPSGIYKCVADGRKICDVLIMNEEVREL